MRTCCICDNAHPEVGINELLSGYTWLQYRSFCYINCQISGVFYMRAEEILTYGGVACYSLKRASEHHQTKSRKAEVSSISIRVALKLTFAAIRRMLHEVEEYILPYLLNLNCCVSVKSRQMGWGQT